MAGEILDELGYEPQREAPTELRLRNCPFHPLSARAPDVVCKVNQAYLSGLLDGLGATSAKAVPDPDPDPHLLCQAHRHPALTRPAPCAELHRYSALDLTGAWR